MKSILKKVIMSVLQFEARMALFRHKPKIVAVTGTVGKTSTKDVIYECLKPYFNTRKSEKSFNSDIGLPLTILGLQNAWSSPIGWIWNLILGFFVLFDTRYPNWLVLEIGIDRPGDMKKVAKWLKTDVVVFTKFSQTPVHVEYFDSPKEVIFEKSLLADTLKIDGTLILNRDDEEVFALGERARRKHISYGFHTLSDIKASNQEFLYDDSNKLVGIIFRADYGGSSIPVRIIGSLGQGQVYGALAGLAVGTALGINIVSLSDAISGYQPPNGRMRIISGIKNCQIIDDTYNSSPVALSSAIATFKEIKAKRKIAILGDMLELGKYSIDEHKKIGKNVAGFVDMFVAVGERMKIAVDEALSNGMREEVVLHFDTSSDAGAYIQNLIKEGDIILVKGSQSIRMEKIVEEIMAVPDKKAELLVRQDKEWQNR